MNRFLFDEVGASVLWVQTRGAKCNALEMIFSKKLRSCKKVDQKNSIQVKKWIKKGIETKSCVFQNLTVQNQ